MHYPQDIKGGQQMALLIVGALMQNDEFKKDFDAAKLELQAGL
jgi:hypothetical protein